MKIQYKIKDYLRIGSKVMINVTEDNLKYLHQVNLDCGTNPNWIEKYGDKVFTIEKKIDKESIECEVECVRVKEHWTIPIICLKKVK